MNRFAEVARIIGGDRNKVVPKLARYSLLIAGPERGPDNELELEDKELWVVMDWLNKALSHEKRVIEALEELDYGFDFADELDAVDGASNAFFVFMNYVEANISPPRSGGSPPNRKRRLCAAVCAELWRDVKGKAQPYSLELWDACEEYWKACGNPGLTDEQGAKLWQHYLLKVSHQ
jgi:hypothetical protein